MDLRALLASASLEPPEWAALRLSLFVASIAVVTDGKTVTVFGACTPMAAPTK